MTETACQAVCDVTDLLTRDQTVFEVMAISLAIINNPWLKNYYFLITVSKIPPGALLKPYYHKLIYKSIGIYEYG